MVIKYFLICLKKVSVQYVFPLVYMIPLITILYVNLVNKYGQPYQLYNFYKNGNFNYIADDQLISDNAFYMNSSTLLSSHYSDDKSVAGNKYYDNNVATTLYLCQSTEALKNSFFTEHNLLKGNIPDLKIYEDCRKEGVYPLCVTVGISKKLNSDIGDLIFYNSNTKELIFKIVGLLKSDGNTFSEFGKQSRVKSYSCAVIDEDMLSSLSNDYSKKDNCFIQFNKERKNENYIYKQLLIQYIINIGNKYTIILDILLSGTIISILCYFTFNIINMRYRTDMVNLYKLGMNKLKISLLFFLLTSFILLIAITITLCLMKFFILPYIIFQFYDLFLLLVLACILFTIGCMVNVFYSLTKIKL